MRNGKQGAAGALIIAGFVTLLLMASGYLMAFSRLNFVKARLASAANTIASVGSVNLLNISSVCESMQAAFVGLFPDEGASLELKEDTTLDLNLYFFSGVTATGGQAAAYKVPASGPCSITGLVTLPISKIKVELTAEVKISSFVPLQHFMGISKLTTTMAAEAEAKLAPMDVVLVIDNSNSVISPPSATDPHESTGFDVYEDQAVGGLAANATSKKEIYTGACFGFVNRRLKQAAIKLYDVLTSVSTNRVGVAFTNPGQGEPSGLAIKLDQSPWERPAAGNSDEIVPDYIPSPIGAVDAYSSRCAAITDDYPVPNHPFADWIGNIDEIWLDSGVITGRLYCSEQGDCPSGNASYVNKHDSAQVGLLPREVIWTANAGLFSSDGSLLKQGNVNLLEATLKRVAQELAFNDAQQDTTDLPDEQIAARKLILYITDGVDVVPSSTAKPKIDPTRVDQTTAMSGALAANGTVLPSSVVTELAVPKASPTPSWGGMKEIPCEMTLGDSKIWLGVLYFHWRAEGAVTPASYPQPYLEAYYMPGHEYEDEDEAKPNAMMAAWRTACKSSDGPAVGTFMIESSATSEPDEFVKEIIPAVLKAIMLPN